MRVVFYLFVATFLVGCVYKNECGYSTNFYNDCVEGYDAQGIYYKKCPQNNIIDSCKPKHKSLLEECINCN